MQLLRLILTWTFFPLSLLTSLAAPAWHLWLVSILVTEFCWVFALLSILLIVWNYRAQRHRWAGVALGLLALCFFCYPLVAAWRMSERTKKELTTTFQGVHLPTQPFSLAELFTAWTEKPLTPNTLTYHQDTAVTLTMDFYSAQQKKIAPCVMVIHGGAWSAGDSRQLPELNHRLAKLGYHVAAINYRKAPKYKSPAPLEDTRRALAYLRTNALHLGIDTQKIVLLGRSAGAQIALMAAYTEPAGSIAGVISFYGPADMVWGWTLPANPLVMDSRKVMRDYLGGSYDEVPEQYAASSATLAVSAGAPPTLMIHGLNDPLVAYEHNTRLIKNLKAYKVPYFLLTLPWATHGFDYTLHGPGGQLSSYAVTHFLQWVSLQKSE